MTPLRVALVHRDSPRANEQRAVGWWAYDVPEFQVHHIPVRKGFVLDLSALAPRHDLVVWEDCGAYGVLVNRGALPVAYVVVDSTLGWDAYRVRYEHATQAGLILVDHDRLDRFDDLGVPVRRLGYAPNDRYYRDYGEAKTVDVSMLCHPSDDGARARLMTHLARHCAARGYTFTSGKRSGEEYPRGFNRAKVSVNLARTTTNRPHRTFDVMACRSCLLTSPWPRVSGEEDVRRGVHYVDFRDADEACQQIDALLETGDWARIADAGYALVQARYTWSALAGRLRATLLDAFPQLREAVRA